MILKLLPSLAVFLAVACCNNALIAWQLEAISQFAGGDIVGSDVVGRGYERRGSSHIDSAVEPSAFKQSVVAIDPVAGSQYGYIDGSRYFGDYAHQIYAGDTVYSYTALGRGFFIDDQRIAWTGQELTFGAEAVLAGAAQRIVHGWNVGLVGEFFINQPFDRNILVDTANRVSHRGNFDYETFQISRLFLEASKGDWSISLGKRNTPFGRYYYPLHRNNQFDAPFIRTEAINIRETGVQLQYTPGIWDVMVGIVNGSEDLDTNSSKAGIARIGINGQNFALGGSIKWQDGIGSESQKYRDNQVGMDAMIQRGRWQLSGEVIYDEYGFRRYFNPFDITWGRSIYHRDQFTSRGVLNGVGYYVNLNYTGEKWSTCLNYGNYTPGLFTGDPIHDQVTHRFITKVVRHFGQGLDCVNTFIFENDVEQGQAGRRREGYAYYAALEYRF